MPTLDQMKQIAEQKAAPVLEKLKGDPNNTDLLTQAGNIYLSTHQFKEAAGYFDRVLQVDPKNVAVRTQMASCMYYNGDVDGAISQLQQSLHYDPKDANSLFNLGMIKWQGKHDGKGAVAAWQQLLKSNPQLSADRKAQPAETDGPGPDAGQELAPWPGRDAAFGGFRRQPKTGSEGALRNDGYKSSNFYREMDKRASLHVGGHLSAGGNRRRLVHPRIPESGGRCG